MRMQREGRRHDPSFRIVVTESARGPKDRRHVDILGNYNVAAKDLKLDGEKAKHWISQGAQVSPRVWNLLISEGVIEGNKVNVLPQKTVQESEQQEDDVQTAEANEEETSNEAAQGSDEADESASNNDEESSQEAEQAQEATQPSANEEENEAEPSEGDPQKKNEGSSEPNESESSEESSSSDSEDEEQEGAGTSSSEEAEEQEKS